MDSTRRPFSKRYGYRPAPKEITVREGAPESLRHFVLNKALELGFSPNGLRSAICDILHVRPDRNNWSASNVWSEVEYLVYECEWFAFYDFMEFLYAYLRGTHIDGHPAIGEMVERAQQYQDAVNEFFVDEGIGWQMVEGQIVVRGTETFESNVHAANEALEKAGRLTARSEIHEAIVDLSRRPEADLTGAVQHAMAALECVARDVCGDEHATLGQVIKKYPDAIPRPLDEAVEKAWGFASEMARHIREGRRPDYKEVELIVGLAAVVGTYLSR
jgi:hypothetical protein